MQADTRNSPVLRLTVPSSVEYVCVMRRLMRGLFCMAGAEERLAKMLALAVEEAWTNIIRHAYEGRQDCPILLEVVLHSDRVAVTLHDSGRPCSQQTFEPRERKRLEPGRLGLRLVHDVFDEVIFDDGDPDLNRLTLVRYHDSPLQIDAEDIIGRYGCM